MLELVPTDWLGFQSARSMSVRSPSDNFAICAPRSRAPRAKGLREAESRIPLGNQVESSRVSVVWSLG